jgi:hypothetical protein
MIDLIIDNEVIDIPNEINIGMYQQINTNPTKYKNPLQLISLFTNITIHDLKNMKKEQVELIESVIGNKLVLPQENKLVMTFEYEGIEYGLENDWSKMAWGAWVDFEVYCADDKIYENLHRIMAILYRPITHKDKKNPLKYKIEPYKSQDIEARSEIMRLVPVSIWLGSALFFLEIVKTYINNINHSLSLMTKIQTKILTIWKKMPKWLKKVLPLASISPSLTSSQKKILQNFNK